MRNEDGPVFALFSSFFCVICGQGSEAGGWLQPRKLSGFPALETVGNGFPPNVALNHPIETGVSMKLAVGGCP
jgi:hypothetical protein